jgi:hypothetical protein
MSLLLMEFLTGYKGDLYQEVQYGRVTRWFDMNGNEVTLPDNDGKGVSYKLKDDNPPIPEWYITPEENL